MKSTKTTVEQKFLKFVQGNLYEWRMSPCYMPLFIDY